VGSGHATFFNLDIPKNGTSRPQQRMPELDLTLAEMFEQEQPSLMPMITPFDGYVETIGEMAHRLPTCRSVYNDCADHCSSKKAATE
jgi:hypothetical protein